MTINLSFTNSSAIEMKDGLATNINDTYLTLGAKVIRDVGRNNPAVTIVSVDGIMASNHTPDTTRPNLNILVFDEAVNIRSLNYLQITFQDRQNISEVTESYTLTGGTSTPSYAGVTINVSLIKYDPDNLKDLTMLDYHTISNQLLSRYGWCSFLRINILKNY